MNIELKHVEQLLAMLCEKTGRTLDHRGITEMVEAISKSGKLPDNEIPKSYLYDTLFKGLEKARAAKEKTLSLRDNKLNSLAIYLDYPGIHELLQAIARPVDPVLASCVGEYYSYVRQNTESGAILRSPVSIVADGKTIRFNLQGPHWSYTGELKLSQGCLFVLMVAVGGKMIHHVYRIGSRKQPDVLQGIFSGISSTSDPIGGRAVLLRLPAGSSNLTNKRLEIEQLKQSTLLEERRLAEYFSIKSENNLSIRTAGPLTLSLDDLGEIA